MDYKETLDYLYRRLPMFQKVGKKAFKKDLSNTYQLCRHLGLPHQKFNAIHIAGTNGKGSVAHLLAATLQEAGYKTGLYTSPHLNDFRERIRVNSNLIPKQAVIDFVEDNQKAFERIQPSFFELTVALAFYHFAVEEVDIAVLETGMGGRLDSTNVITPLVSVITNISLDHTQFLGNTLPEIAAEKAGIIKEQVPAVIGEFQPETAPVFKKKAKERSAPLLFADQVWSTEISDKEIDRLILHVFKAGELMYEHLTVPIAAQYEAKNVVTALAALDQLNQYESFTMIKQDIKHGFGNVTELNSFSGRWEIYSRSPLTICDCAHNPASLKLVTEQLKALASHHLHVIFGTVRDKDLNSLLPLLPQDASYYFVRPDVPRGLEANKLQEKAASYKLQGTVYPSVKKALKAAQESAEETDVIFVGGSTFVVAEVL